MKVILGFLVASMLGTGAAVAQPATEQPPAAPPVMAVQSDAREVRDQLRGVLAKYPPEVGRILRMDPTMLSNQQYLAQYPAVQQFLAAHPEIARNPGYYLSFVGVYDDDYSQPLDARAQAVRAWGGFLEYLGVFLIVALISSTFAWLIKTGLNYRRWLRTSRVQTEVHNKLLDRFATTNDLLAYVQTPAGRRFLEAAPIPVDTPVPEKPIAAPLNRIMVSVQAGIVLVIGGLGFQFVASRVITEVAEGVWTIGVLATAFGLGFIAAGAFSFVMSRRLGLLDSSPPVGGAERGDSPLV